MKRHSGFTLVELLIAIVIVSILSAIAYPAYRDYVTRSRLTEAFSALSTVQPNAEQFWSNNRTYAGFDQLPPNTPYFSYALSNASASTYTVTATGAGPVAGFVFTINQSGARSTAGAPSGWATNTACWVDRKNGSCVQ